jgi:hypothetical protein
MTGSREYRSWIAMKKRCFNPRASNYEYYGGRGISVCEDWRPSFVSFFADTGERPLGCSLDRIDPNGNYEPGNVQWATASEQSRNRRPRKRKARRAKLEDIRAYADALARAKSTPGGTGATP